jgi:hypothetical protein
MDPTLQAPPRPAYRTPRWKGLPGEASLHNKEIGGRYAALIRLALRVLGPSSDPSFEHFTTELDTISSSDGLEIAVIYGENLLEVVMFELEGDEG